MSKEVRFQIKSFKKFLFLTCLPVAPLYTITSPPSFPITTNSFEVATATARRSLPPYLDVEANFVLVSGPRGIVKSEMHWYCSSSSSFFFFFFFFSSFFHTLTRPLLEQVISVPTVLRQKCDNGRDLGAARTNVEASSSCVVVVVVVVVVADAAAVFLVFLDLDFLLLEEDEDEDEDDDEDDDDKAAAGESKN